MLNSAIALVSVIMERNYEIIALIMLLANKTVKHPESILVLASFELFKNRSTILKFHKAVWPMIKVC